SRLLHRAIPRHRNDHDLDGHRGFTQRPSTSTYLTSIPDPPGHKVSLFCRNEDAERAGCHEAAPLPCPPQNGDPCECRPPPVPPEGRSHLHHQPLCKSKRI